MNVDELLEPSKLYKSVVKPAHQQNAADFFDGLVKKSGIDIDANKATNKKISKLENEIDVLSKNIRKKENLKIAFSIISAICLMGAAFILITLFILASNQTQTILKIVGTIALLVVGIFLLLRIKNIKNEVNTIVENKKKLEAKKDDYVKEAFTQMSSLNALFDWNMSTQIFNKTIPLIKLDPIFDQEKYQMLHEKYNFNGNPEKNVSSVFIQSGSILGNAFLYERNYVCEMVRTEYQGSLTISWTTSYEDSEGHVHTEHHTQTLHASVYKPAPIYYYENWLVYGNDAAGKLNFSRYPSDANKMNEKQVQKLVESYEKKLDKMTQDSISKGTNFQRLGNTEFEALFNALDRDNNIEFRLLFTPLAQKNLTDLILSKEPYGDDFAFVKKGNLNYIKTAHSQGKNFDGNPNQFIFYNIDKSREYFIQYNMDFLQCLYFDLAPLLSIPLYQQHAAQEYIYKGTLNRNITEMETEVLANSYNPSVFIHKNSETSGILKTELIEKGKAADLNKVHAYSYKTIAHVDYVPVFGGDGNYHDVPVQWLEYVSIQKDTEFVVQKLPVNKQQFDRNYRNEYVNQFLSQFAKNNDIIYKKGLASFLSTNFANYDGEKLNKLFNKGE